MASPSGHADDTPESKHGCQQSRWSDGKLVVQAYKHLRQDLEVYLADRWISDVDIVRLLNARYQFQTTGVKMLTPKNLNRHFSKMGAIVLGENFDAQPSVLNLYGHYRSWQKVRPSDSVPHAFYYACSGEALSLGVVPVLEEVSENDAFSLNKNMLESDLVANQIFPQITTAKDEVAYRLLQLRLAKEQAGRDKSSSSERKRKIDDLTVCVINLSDKNIATDMNIVAQREQWLRRKPAPESKSKPPVQPKFCVGWSGTKFDDLIRESLLKALGNQRGKLEIPTIFSLVGPKDFFVHYDKDNMKAQFTIFAEGHDFANCERVPSSYKHCAVCVKASGRLRTYRYLESKPEKEFVAESTPTNSEPMLQQRVTRLDTSLSECVYTDGAMNRENEEHDTDRYAYYLHKQI